MIKYVVKRILLSILTVLVFYAFIYMIVRYSHLFKWTRGFTKLELIEITFNEMVVHFKNIVTRFDWGLNLRGESVWELIRNGIPISLRINLYGFAFYLLTGVSLGMICAIKKNTIFDSIISSFTLLIGSVPTFVWMLLLIIFLAFRLDLVPPEFTMVHRGYFGSVTAYLIPVLALSFEPISRITRLVRSELIDAEQSEHNLLCRAKGMTRRQILFRHNFKHILAVLLPQLGTIFLYALINSFFVEDMYNIDGIARLLLNHVVTYNSEDMIYYTTVDINLLMIISMYIIVFQTIVLLVSDLLMGFVDPRIRLTSKKA